MVHPIADPEFEREIVLQQLADWLGADRRDGRGCARRVGTAGPDLPGSAHRAHAGWASLNRPDAVMSTAEAVNAACRTEAVYLDMGGSGAHIARQIQGDPEGLARGRQALPRLYHHIVKERTAPGRVARLLSGGGR